MTDNEKLFVALCEVCPEKFTLAAKGKAVIGPFNEFLGIKDGHIFGGYCLWAMHLEMALAYAELRNERLNNGGLPDGKEEQYAALHEFMDCKAWSVMASAVIECYVAWKRTTQPESQPA